MSAGEEHGVLQSFSGFKLDCRPDISRIYVYRESGPKAVDGESYIGYISPECVLKVDPAQMFSANDLERLALLLKCVSGQSWSKVATGAALIRGGDILASHRHDAGAYGKCSFCGRYSDNHLCLSLDFRCDCGKKNGFSGSFVSPDKNSSWCHNPGSLSNPFGEQGKS